MREERSEGVWHLRASDDPGVPLVFDSPHSGTEFPTDFRSIASLADVREPEDSFIDEIHGTAPDSGAVLLRALFPRIYLDPNRSTVDLDPNQIDGDWPDPLSPSKKTSSGTGLIWTKAPNDANLYDRKLTVAEVRHRIDTYLIPYQAKLKAELDRAYEVHKAVWHVNCHSMPAISTPRAPEGEGGIRRSDFYIGTIDGQTAGAEYTELIRETLAGFGYDVQVNKFFKGVELISAFSDPASNRHSLQIEINRGLYMDEDAGWRSDNFGQIEAHMGELIKVLSAYASAQIR